MTVPFPQLRRRLVAILRGVKTGEIIEVGTAVFEAGIEAIEVPLNSPDPFRSIEMLAKILPKNALIGAGTVLTAAQVDDLYNAGGRLLVSPSIDRAFLERAATLTKQLLAFARRQTIQLRPLRLESVVRGLAEVLRRVVGEHIELVL